MGLEGPALSASMVRHGHLTFDQSAMPSVTPSKLPTARTVGADTEDEAAKDPHANPKANYSVSDSPGPQEPASDFRKVVGEHPNPKL